MELLRHYHVSFPILSSPTKYATQLQKQVRETPENNSHVCT